MNFILEGRKGLTQCLDNLDGTSSCCANIFAAPFRHEQIAKQNQNDDPCDLENGA